MKRSTNRRPSKSRQRSERYRPGLLSLEDRLLLSVFTVNDPGDNAVGSGTSGDLHYCLSHVASGDTVTFAVTGTIDLARPLPNLNGKLTIQGPGSGSLTVERGSSGGFRIFDIGTGATVQISGLTIANGTETEGGAIYNNGGNLTLTDTVFMANAVSDNKIGDGGAIYNSGTLTVTNSQFTNNSATSGGSNQTGDGGAIYNAGTLTVTNSQFTNNAATNTSGSPGGGAIYNANSRMANISGSTFSGNTTKSKDNGFYLPATYGGGVDNAGTLTVTGSTFSANTASVGAGIYNAGAVTVSGSTFSGNNGSGLDSNSRMPAAIHDSIFSSNSGVAVVNEDDAGCAFGCLFGKGNMTVSGSTISGNTGGGISNSDVTLTVTNSTVANNSGGSGITNAGMLTISDSTVANNSGTNGGGINDSGMLTLNNSTVAGNTAGSGGGLYVTGVVNALDDLIAGNMAPMGPDIFGRISSKGHNLIQDPSQGDGFASNDLLSIDPKLGPLAANGGPTQTMALMPGSPAIDAGDNTGAPQWDQRGPGFARIANGTIDIGAFEFQIVANPVLTIQIFAVGGAPGHVQVHRVSDGATVADFAPYGPSYKGGVSVAVGDVDGDGFPDLVTGATVGNPQVKVFSGKAFSDGSFNAGNPDASLLASFFAYGLNFNVGANVAVGDVNHDGFADIVTGATAGNPQVKVYDGQAIAHHSFNGGNPDASLLASFFAYGLQFNIGANVAVGDVNHDGFADVVTGATAGNPQVKVYDGQAIANHSFNGGNPDASLLASFFAFGLQFNVGAFVAVGDVNGDGFGDVIAGATAGNPQVKVYDGQAIANHSFNGGNPDANLLTNFYAYDLGRNIGASVGVADFDVGGPAEILTGAAQGAPHYRVVKGLASGIQPPADHGIDAIASDISGGILVGG